MRIGELAKRAGTTTRTLRYYEARGLLPARRDERGYRVYIEDDLRVLSQIKMLQDFGFDLEETRPFVECLQAGHPTGDACLASIEVYRRKLTEIDDCIAQLESVRDRIRGQLTRTGLPQAPPPRCALGPYSTLSESEGEQTDDARRRSHAGDGRDVRR